MRKGLAIGLVALTVSPAQSPTTPMEKVAWLAKNGVPIRSLDPDGEDFSDFQPLAHAIGDARVVMLGGTTAAGTPYAKGRLVRFLHQEMGFDVLAATTSFFDAEDVDLDWDRGRNPDPEALNAAESRFHPIFSNTQLWPMPPEGKHDRLPPPRPPRGQNRLGPPGTLDLATYLLSTHQSQRPLDLVGTEPSLPVLRPLSLHKNLVDKLFAAIDRAAPHVATASDRRTIESLLGLVQLRAEDPRWQQSEAVWNATERILNRLIDALGRAPKNSPDAREAVLFQYSLIRLRYESLLSARPPRPVKPEPPLDALVWIAKVWRPESKIVVWSWNDRIGRNTAIAKELGAKVYSLAFDSIVHERDAPLVLEAGPPPSFRPMGNDLESLLHAVDKPVLFFDFRSLPEGHWLRAPITSSILYGSTTWTADQSPVAQPTTMAWPERYDGLISVDSITSRGQTK